MKLKENIEKINEMKKDGCFNNYINYIQFPIFKNLESNTRINFDFPLTVLIGKNGCNKSSVLTALYGAPKGKSTGNFWFSTSTDPIKEDTDRGRNRYFYQYVKDESSLGKEVLKQRMKRDGDPDYWETSDPVKSIGMTDTVRHSPVDKNVIYIDFRGQLSAFDKFFYFGEYKNEKKQDFLRKRSIHVKRAFENEDPRFPGQNGKKTSQYALDSRIELSDKEIYCINEILGKKYESIIMVEHKFYDKVGTSALLISQSKSGKLQYSEANAGSGETAVIRLVHSVMNAEKYSLILLDEPEVSLHPSAQRKVKDFLLNEIINKKHQIIISSHSPAIIKDLPKEAIKLFTTNEDGYFHVQENIDYRLAFFELEEYVVGKKVIICEDIDAKNLIERTLRYLGKSEYFIVEFAHGGADTLLNHVIPMYAINEELKNSIFFILDGDKECKRENSGDYTLKQRNDISFLEERVKSIYCNNLPKAYPDGGKNGGREDQKCEIYLQYIDYHYSNVSYLPNKKIPEEIVLNSEYVRNHYPEIIDRHPEFEKDRFKNILRDIEKERDDKEIIDTFEALSHELFFENKKDPNPDISDLSYLLNSIFENNTVMNQEMCGVT